MTSSEVQLIVKKSHRWKVVILVLEWHACMVESLTRCALAQYFDRNKTSHTTFLQPNLNHKTYTMVCFGTLYCPFICDDIMLQLPYHAHSLAEDPTNQGKGSQSSSPFVIALIHLWYANHHNIYIPSFLNLYKTWLLVPFSPLFCSSVIRPSILSHHEKSYSTSVSLVKYLV